MRVVFPRPDSPSQRECEYDASNEKRKVLTDDH